jgi:hypothetical protein
VLVCAAVVGSATEGVGMSPPVGSSSWALTPDPVVCARCGAAWPCWLVKGTWYCGACVPKEREANGVANAGS